MLYEQQILQYTNPLQENSLTVHRVCNEKCREMQKNMLQEHIAEVHADIERLKQNKWRITEPTFGQLNNIAQGKLSAFKLLLSRLG